MKITELIRPHLVVPEGFKLYFEERDVEYQETYDNETDLFLGWGEGMDSYIAMIEWVGRDISDINNDIEKESNKILGQIQERKNLESLTEGFDVDNPPKEITIVGRQYFLTNNTELIYTAVGRNYGEQESVIINAKEKTLSRTSSATVAIDGEAMYSTYYITPRGGGYQITKSHINRLIEKKEVFLYTIKKEGEQWDIE